MSFPVQEFLLSCSLGQSFSDFLAELSEQFDKSWGRGMSCNKCGQKNLDGSLFCSSCGSSIAEVSSGKSLEISDSSDTNVPQKTKPKYLEKKFLISGGAAAVVLAAITFVLLPKPVAIEIGVIAPNGGVFDASCNVLSDAEAQTPLVISLSTQPDKSSPMSFPIKYSLSSSGSCVGKVNASLSPFANYFVFNGGDKIAEITPTDVGAGKASIGTSVIIERDLRVNFNLYDKADRCSGSTSSWSCSWNNDYVFGLKLNSKTGKCSGQNGFSDIRKGTTVKVEGRGNQQVATGTLMVDTYELVSVGSKKIVCKFYATFSGIANDDLGYAITTANRGTVDFDLDQVRQNGWVADLQLNQ